MSAKGGLEFLPVIWALCGNQKVDVKGGIMVCKLKGWMDKEGQYDV